MTYLFSTIPRQIVCFVIHLYTNSRNLFWSKQYIVPPILFSYPSLSYHLSFLPLTCTYIIHMGHCIVSPCIRVSCVSVHSWLPLRFSLKVIQFNTHQRSTICHFYAYVVVGWFMVFKATFKNISVISCQSVLLMEDIGVSGENHQPGASHWQTLSHNVASSTFDSTTMRSRPRRPHRGYFVKKKQLSI